MQLVNLLDSEISAHHHSLVNMAPENQQRSLLPLLTTEQASLVDDYFAALASPHTRELYSRATERFLAWAAGQGIPSINAIGPQHIGAFAEQLAQSFSPMSVRMYLMALRRVFDFLLTSRALPGNPARLVPHPKVDEPVGGKTVPLTSKEADTLLGSIKGTSFADLRDRAIFSLLLFTDVPATGIVGLRVRDYLKNADGVWLRICEKAGRVFHVQVHEPTQKSIEQYLSCLPSADPSEPLFRANSRGFSRPIHRLSLPELIVRRAAAAGFKRRVSAQQLRMTGRTQYGSQRPVVRLKAQTQLPLFSP